MVSVVEMDQVQVHSRVQDMILNQSFQIKIQSFYIPFSLHCIVMVGMTV